MKYFPLFVDTQSLNILVVGAGEVASRKLDLLTRTQAKIHVIAKEVCDEVQSLQRQGKITLDEKAVLASDLQNQDLVYLATADNALNERLAKIASTKGIWVNVVDNPEFCRFITPSIVDRGRLQIAISTAGAAPVFARELRARLESWLPQSLTPLFDFVAQKRQEVQTNLTDFKQRRVFWERFFKLNGDRFDSQTSKNYEAAYGDLDITGEVLLIDNQTPIELLPLLAVTQLQKVDVVYSRHEQPLPFELAELVRRDASKEAIAASSESSLTTLLQERRLQGQRCLVYTTKEKAAQIQQAIPQAIHFQAGKAYIRAAP